MSIVFRLCRSFPAIGLLLAVFGPVSVASGAPSSGDDEILSAQAIGSRFAEALSMTVASPPFEKQAIEDGVTRLHIRSLYESWAASGSPLIDPDALVSLLEARVRSIWSGRMVADWVQEQVGVSDDDGDRRMAGVAQVRLEWSGERFRSRVVVPDEAPTLPSSEVAVGTVVSDGRQILVVGETQDVAARLYPVAMPALHRSRFAYLHPLSQVEAHNWRGDVSLNSPPRIILDMAESMKLAAERGALYVLPEALVVDGFESLVVIEMVHGIPKYYFLSLEHGLAPIRIEWVEQQFSRDGVYQGRKLTTILRLIDLFDAGDGIFLPGRIQRLARIDFPVHQRADGVIEPAQSFYQVFAWDVSAAEINRPVPDRIFSIRLLSQGRIIDDRIRGTRWAYNADGMPDVGEALLIASGNRSLELTNVVDRAIDGDALAGDDWVTITVENTQGIREAMMCTVVAGFVALHQLGFDVTMREVAARFGWETGSPRTARNMADGMAMLAAVHSDLRQVSLDEVHALLAMKSTAVLLLLDLNRDDVAHISAVVGSEADGSLITAEYPQLQRLLTPEELALRWTGEVLVVSHAAPGGLAATAAPSRPAGSRLLYLSGAVGALMLGLAFVLVGRKPRRETVAC